MPTSRATRVTSEANERSWSTIVLMASLSCRISPRTSTVIFFDRSPLATAMVTSAMLRTCAVRFDAIELTLSVRSFQTPVTSLHLRLAAELAFGADLARDARHLRGEHAELLDHGVDDGRRAQELALERAPVDLEPHRLQQVALRDRGDGAGDFGGRPEQIVDQRVDRGFHLAPGAVRQAELDALAGLAFAADDLADALELLRHALVGGDDLVEGVGDLAEDADLVAGMRTEKSPTRMACSAFRRSCNSAGAPPASCPSAGTAFGRRAIGLKIANRFTVRLHGVSSGAGEPAQCHGRGGVVMATP